MNLEKVIKECQDCNVDAQEALYKAFGPLLFGICMKYCKEKSLAEDLFQDAFITIFNKIGQFKFKGSFEGWIKRVTINTILSHFKKNKTEFVTNEIEISEPEEEFRDFSAYSLNQLLGFIQALPDQYRLVFNLYVLDEYSHKEIALALKISEGTSKSNLSRAKSLLRKKLEAHQKSCPNE